MSSATANAGFAGVPSGAAQVVHPVWVRVTHWVNAVAMFVMIGSGWRIYNASPLFPFAFPPALTLGDGMDGLPGALLWHFAAMWLLVVNGVTYVALGRDQGQAERRLDCSVIAAEQRDHDQDRPDCERDVRDGGQPLADEIVST